MDITIKVNCDNAAFDETPLVELQWILAQALIKVRLVPGTEGTLLDSNGNKVGKVKVTK